MRFFRRKQEAEASPDAETGESPEQTQQPDESVAAEVAVAEIAPAARSTAETAEEAVPVGEAVERTRRSWFGRIGGMFKRGLNDERLSRKDEVRKRRSGSARDALWGKALRSISLDAGQTHRSPRRTIAVFAASTLTRSGHSAIG